MVATEVLRSQRVVDIRKFSIRGRTGQGKNGQRIQQECEALRKMTNSDAQYDGRRAGKGRR